MPEQNELQILAPREAFATGSSADIVMGAGQRNETDQIRSVQFAVVLTKLAGRLGLPDRSNGLGIYAAMKKYTSDGPIVRLAQPAILGDRHGLLLTENQDGIELPLGVFKPTRSSRPLELSADLVKFVRDSFPDSFIRTELTTRFGTYWPNSLFPHRDQNASVIGPGQDSSVEAGAVVNAYIEFLKGNSDW